MQPSDNDLARLEVLRAIKQKMPRADLGANVSPFDDRITTSLGGPSCDIADIHAPVREYIRDVIASVRTGKRGSQVILLAGGAGAGKTHLLRTFRTAESMAESGHLFVGGSNHWTVGEFPARLLDWVIEAMTSPTPTEDHPLLARVRAIGFRAAELLMANKNSWRACLAAAKGGAIGRLLARWNGPTYEKLTAQLAARDPRLFDHFDYRKFSDAVCDRFLADRSNLLHRLALRVLLTYLFPEDADAGVGPRERVLHWFRGKGDGEYFTRRLGVSEVPDRDYSRFDAVKFLAHLFSRDVSDQLSSEGHPCPAKVLLLTFDQFEGRDELFDSDDDWRIFFAHLSELYNTLPNVVVLFTMTVGLRSRLHTLMERQFKDRIRMDERSILRQMEPGQILLLYRSRMGQWLRNDPIHATYQSLAGDDDPFLPLTRAAVTGVGPLPPREAMRQLDERFHAEVRRLAIDVTLDHHYERNEIRAARAGLSEWDATAEHLDTLARLLDMAGETFLAPYGLEIRERAAGKANNTKFLRLVLAAPGSPASVTVYVARLGKNFNDPIINLIEACLYNRTKAKTFLRLLRSMPLGMNFEASHSAYARQMAYSAWTPEDEAALAALIVIAGRRELYRATGREAELDRYIQEEIRRSYLGSLLQAARDSLAASSAAESDPVPTP